MTISPSKWGFSVREGFCRVRSIWIGNIRKHDHDQWMNWNVLAGKMICQRRRKWKRCVENDNLMLNILLIRWLLPKTPAQRMQRLMEKCWREKLDWAVRGESYMHYCFSPHVIQSDLKKFEVNRSHPSKDFSQSENTFAGWNQFGLETSGFMIEVFITQGEE